MEIKDIIQTEDNLYRLDKQQVEFLAEMVAEKINQGVRKGLPNLCLDKNKGITHGAFKGYLEETGEKRTEYFYQVLKTLNQQ